MTSLLFVNYKQHLNFHTFSILWKNIEYIDTTELVKLCYFIHEPWILLFQFLPVVHGNCTTSKCRRRASKMWWPTFQGSAFNAAINTENSGSREVTRSKFFCICYTTSSAERKRRPTAYIENCVLWSAKQEMYIGPLSLYTERFLWLSGLGWNWCSVNLATAVGRVSVVLNVTYTLMKECELEVCFGYHVLCLYANGCLGGTM
jgi:hypothetical protein